MNRSKLIIILSAAILCIVTILCVMLVMILPSLTENSNKLIFISDSREAYYDGSVLKGDTWSMISGELKSGHRAEVTLSGSQLYVGTSKNLMQVRILDSSGADVTSDYNIECVPGDLTVKSVNLTITSNSNSKVYDGEPLSDDGYIVVPAYTVPPQHELTVDVTGTITEIGETSNTVSRAAVYDANGKDVTFNFNILIIEGTLKVTDENGLDMGDLNLDLDFDGIPDLNIDIDGDMIPDLDIDINGDMLPDLDLDLDGDMIPDINLDLDGNMIPDLDIDLDGDMIPDMNLDLNGDMIPDLDIDTDGNLIPDVNIDTNGDQMPDMNLDLNGDMIPDLDIDTDGNLMPDVNIDTNGDQMPDMNLDLDGDLKSDLDIDLDGDMFGDLNIDIDGDLKPDINIDNNGNLKPDVNIDTNGDLIPDLNTDINGDRVADLDVDLNGDLKPDINIDTNGDMMPDINIDTDGNLIPDINIDTNGDMIPDFNVDTNGDGIPDKNVVGSGSSGLLDISGNIGAGDIGDLGAGADKVVCYKVTADTNDKVYLKMANFGSYNGQKWEAPKQYGGLVYSYGSADYLSGIAMNNVGKNLKTISIEILNGQGVMPYYSYIYGSYFANSSDVMVMYDYQHVTFQYFNDGYNGVVLPEDIMWYEEQYRSFVYDNYLYIDAETYAYMQMIAESNGFSSSDPEVINAVASYIQHAAKYDLKYDRALDREENIAIKFLDEYKSGICQHYASAATLLYRALGIPARYTVGFVCDTVAGKTVDVTAMQAHAWVEVYIDGIGWIAVEVTGSDGSTSGPGGTQGNLKKITLTPATSEKRYDGEPLVADNKLKTTADLIIWTSKGYTFVPVISGERTEPGKSESVITDIHIYDPAGEDVTDEFDIKFATGIVHVYLDEIRFTSDSIQKEYDGTVLEGDVSGVTLIGDNLPLGYTWQATTNTVKTKNVGSCQNTFKIILFNENGEDVTDMYKITRRYGTLEITPRSITVTAGSATASYTGEPLVCNDIFITSGELVEGEYIFDYVVEGSQTDRGRSDNIVKSITIYDQKGNDVTSNYSIIFQKGTLKVTN